MQPPNWLEGESTTPLPPQKETEMGKLGDAGVCLAHPHPHREPVCAATPVTLGQHTGYVGYRLLFGEVEFRLIYREAG